MDFAHYFAAYLLAFGRCYGFFSVMPQIGEQEFPPGVKFALIACITPFLAFGSLSTPVGHEIVSGGYLILLGKEVVVGIFVGFLVSLPLRLPALIGDVIDGQRGAAVNSQYNPSLGEESAILSQLLGMCLAVYFYTEGGFERLIGILSSSFALQPISSMAFGFGDNFVEVFMVAVINYLQLFAILSLPVLLVMLLADFSLGLASRFAPSLNVFSMSQPIKSVAALAMLVSLHPRLMNAYMKFFNEIEAMFL